MATITSQSVQRDQMFELIETQLQNALAVTQKARSGTENPSKAVNHLIGVASYVNEIAHEIKFDLDRA